MSYHTMVVFATSYNRIELTDENDNNFKLVIVRHVLLSDWIAYMRVNEQNFHFMTKGKREGKYCVESFPSKTIKNRIDFHFFDDVLCVNNVNCINPIQSDQYFMYLPDVALTWLIGKLN